MKVSEKSLIQSGKSKSAFEMTQNLEKGSFEPICKYFKGCVENKGTRNMMVGNKHQNV